MAQPTIPTLVGTLGSLTLLSALLLAFRLAFKRRRADPFRWDDSVLVGAWVRLPLSPVEGTQVD